MKIIIVLVPCLIAMIKKEAGGEVTVAGTGGVWPHCPCSQAAGNDHAFSVVFGLRPMPMEW